jgi:DNA ligase (NAD+)
MCKNANCLGKTLARFTFFVSKPAMNIDGLSEATLEFLIDKGWIKSFRDIYTLYCHGREWEKCDGFGERSVAKILDAIDRSRFVTLESFICALSIEGVGKSASKTISSAFEGSFGQLLSACRSGYDFSKLEDIGSKTSANITKYFKENEMEIVELADEMQFVESTKTKTNNNLEGMTFCITGTFPESREVLKAKLEAKGAKFISGVSKKLTVLFCGESAGSKLTKAKALGIKIMNYDELIKLLED